MDISDGDGLAADDFARRELHVASVSVVVGVGVPRPVDEGASWLCPWYVNDPRSARVDLISGGVDSMQALTSALVAIGDYVGAHFDSETVTWLGREHHGLLQTQAGREPKFHVATARFPTG